MQIRSHAAAALLNLEQRELYGPLCQKALQIFRAAAEELQGNGNTDQDGFSDSGTVCLCLSSMAAEDFASQHNWMKPTMHSSAHH